VFRYFFGKIEITPVHYYHDNSSVKARFAADAGYARQTPVMGTMH
jgi:hypothetical protein